MNKIKLSAFLLSFLILFGNKTYSQFSFQLVTEHEYNNNPFRSRIPERNFISAYDFTLQYEHKNLGVMYNGTAISFNKTGERDFFNHMGGIWANFDSSSVSLSFEQRVNNPLYTYFDYTQADLNYEHHLTLLNMSLDIYPSLSYAVYKNIPLLNNLKSSLSISFNKPFETKTTIIFGGAVNHKIYTRPDYTGIVPVTDDAGIITNTLVESRNATTLTQLTGFFRAAQSVFQSTGAAVQVTGKKIISGIANSVKELSLYYGDESEIFDDPVNYEGISFAAELTQILFSDLELKLGYYNNRKYYPSQGIYEADNTYFTDTEREDSQNIVSFSAKKPFEITEKLGFEIGLKINFIKNASNSYWFQYNSTGVNLNLGLTF